MRGRKPKPTALKILAGNPGKRPLNTAEPQPRAGALTCPAFLDDAARKEWRRVVKALEETGMLTQVDTAGLAGYCLCWSRAQRLEKEVRAGGEVLTDEEGRSYRNPHLLALNSTLKELRGFIADLGLTPVARTRINLPPPRSSALAQFTRKR